MSFSLKQLFSEIQKQDPSLGLCQGCFYLKPLKRIMCGFVIDQRSTGSINIMRFACPMFLGDTGPVPLIFVENLPSPDNFLRPDNLSPFNTASEILRRVSVHRGEIYILSDVDAFLTYLQSLLRNGYGADSNPLWFWGLCMTLIAAGRIDEANQCLSKLVKNGHASNVIGLKNKFTCIEAAMARGNGACIVQLNTWEENFRAACGLGAIAKSDRTES